MMRKVWEGKLFGFSLDMGISDPNKFPKKQNRMTKRSLYVYWNILENCMFKNCIYLNILEIRFCAILEFEKYTGKYTGIYWNFVKSFTGHPVEVRLRHHPS